MSKKKTCPVCGAKMPDEMRFCGSCGADMEQEEQFFADMPRQIRRPDEPRPVETAIRPEKRRGARRSVWQYIIVLVIIAAVIAAAVMLVLKMNQPVTPKEPSETYDTVHVINADGEEIATTAAPEPTSAPEATEPPEATQAPEATEPPEATQAPEATPTPTETTRPYTVTDAGDTVYVTGSGVNLREGPGTNYSILAVLSSGTALKRTGTTDNNWTRVEYQGKEGYLSNAFVSAEEPKGTPAATPAPGDVTPAEDTVIITESANLRTGPGTGYDVITVLAPNTELKRTGVSGSWSRVIHNGSEAYVSSSLVKVKGSDELVERTGTLIVTGAVNLREGPGTDYSIIGLAQEGAELPFTGKIENWYRIEYDGKTAYANGNYVKEK